MSTTNPINLSSAHPALVYSFMKHGKPLSEAILKAKAKEKESAPVDTAEISNAISKIWKGRRDQFGPIFSTEFIPYALDKIAIILGEVGKLHRENERVPKMMLEVEEEQHKLKKAKKEEIEDASTSSKNGGESETSSTPFPWKDHKQSELFNHKEAYNKLNEQQKKCLSFCCALLPYNDDNKVSWVEMSKRELIHWWIGMEFITEPCEGEAVLAKLVAEEFLVKGSSCPAFNRDPKMNSRISSSSRSNSYFIHTNTLSNLNEVTLHMRRKEGEGSHRPLYMMLANQEDKKAEDDIIAVAINRRMFELNDEDFFNKYFQTYDNYENVRILHLSSWPYDPKRFVVVEDIESLKNFLSRTWKSLASLSLRGIVGIIDLPKLIYKIETLKVLDLKSCPNLETMPQGINSLKKLTHLDVSECYLLDQIPEGIESLSELRVLKGFIITEDKENKNNPRSCLKSLPKLKKLIKLDIHARKRDFPTDEDQQTLSEMQQLKMLKITWVLKTNSDDAKDGPEKNEPNHNNTHDDAPVLPATLEKLELQAALEENASKLLDSISYTSGNCPKKLCISGGGLTKLDHDKYRFLNVETLRLRHLPELHLKWAHCQQLFPKLSHLEVFKCPNLIFFPCDDNGIWEKSEES